MPSAPLHPIAAVARRSRPTTCQDVRCAAEAMPGKSWCAHHHALYVLPESTTIMRRCVRDVERIADGERKRGAGKPMAAEVAHTIIGGAGHHPGLPRRRTTA